MNLQDLSQETGPATAARPVTVPLKRFVGGCLLAFLMGVTTGCYTYTSIPAAAPAPGTDVLVGLNDQGRLTLGQSVGPAAQQIEGTVQSQSDSAYVLSVSSVSYFNGGINKWSGEPLTISAGKNSYQLPPIDAANWRRPFERCGVSGDSW